MRLPLVVAVVTILTALLSAMIPAILTYSSQRDVVVSSAENSIAGSADSGKEMLRAFISERATALGCLASDTGFEEVLLKAVEPLPPEPEPDEEGESASKGPLSREEKAAEKARKTITESRATVKSRLKAFCDGHDTCHRVMVANKNNNLIFSTEDSDEGASFGGTLVGNALESAQPVSLISQSLQEQIGAPAVTASRVPCKEYAVLAAFDMSSIFKTLNKMKANLGWQSGRIIVVDNRRQAIMGGLEALKGKSLEISPATRALKGESDLELTVDEEDRRIVAAFRPLGEVGSAVIVTSRIEDIQSADVSFQWGGLIIALVLGIFGGGLVFVLARRAFEPLGLLLNAAERVAAGDLSERVPVMGDDEVSSISRIWNDVVKQLQEARGGIQPEEVPQPQDQNADRQQTIMGQELRLPNAQGAPGQGPNTSDQAPAQGDGNRSPVAPPSVPARDRVPPRGHSS